jgi:glycosyltransferase involved in cell wall biosynthesis
VVVLTGRGSAFDSDPTVEPKLDLDLESIQRDYFEPGVDLGRGLPAAVRHHVFSRRNHRATRRAIRRHRPDLVCLWNLAFVSPSPLLAARRQGVPALMHLSDTAANAFRNPNPPRIAGSLRWLARTAVDRQLRLSRRFVVPSAFLRDKLVGTEGLPEERIQVLPWPVEPSLSHGAARQRPLGPIRRLLFVGTLIPEKGVHVLIEAFARAHQQLPELSLTVVGEGPLAYVGSLREAAAERPVQFMGRLDRPGVSTVYAEHDGLVFPSVWDEPFAVVPLEAMATGLPVVATSAGGTPEAIRDGETGLLVAPDDPDGLARAILRLANDPGLARRLGDAGQAWARAERSFDGFVSRLELLYVGLISEEA